MNGHHDLGPFRRPDAPATQLVVDSPRLMTLGAQDLGKPQGQREDKRGKMTPLNLNLRRF